MGLGAKFLKDVQGAAAAEIVLWVALLVPLVASGVDLGVYLWQRMHVTLAAQAGAQAVRKTCDPFIVPITGSTNSVSNCSGLSAAVTAAVQSTTLGSNVSVVSGTPNEGYYCAGGTQLTLVGTAGTPPTKPNPFNCTSVTAGQTAAPGAYLKVSASFPYTPVFQGMSIGALLPTPIVANAWTRLD